MIGGNWKKNSGFTPFRNFTKKSSHQRRRNQKFLTGFTLMEILVAMVVFSIIITAFLGLFSSAFKYQRESLEKNYLLSNASYITEYMSRALRMAKKDIDGNCTGLKSNFATSSVDIYGNMSIEFLNSNDECQEFTLENERLKVGISSDDTPPLSGDFMDLTPAGITVSNLKFIVIGEPQPPQDYLQPKVTFIIKLEKPGISPFNLQTTVSQRDLDIQY